MTQHNIGKIANLIGLTSEGIRHYERKGLIKKRDDSQKQRTYDTWDIYFFSRIKAYQHFGFSLDEMYDIINHHDVVHLNESLLEKEAQLRKEIQWKLKVLDHIEYKRTLYLDIHQHLHKPRILETEGMFRFPMEHVYTLDDDAQTLSDAKEMFSITPFVFASSRFYADKLDDPVPNYSFGLCILERYKEFIPKNINLEYIPPQKCLVYAFESSSNTVLSKNRFQEALDTLESMNYHLNGDIVTIAIGYHLDGDIKRNYHQAFIPICENTNK